MVQKSQATTWDGAKTLVNSGINYQPQLVIVGFQPSTVVFEICFGTKLGPSFFPE